MSENMDQAVQKLYQEMEEAKHARNAPTEIVYDRNLQRDLRECLRVESHLRMLAFLQALYIEIEELAMSGDEIRSKTKELIRVRIDRCREAVGMESTS